MSEKGLAHALRNKINTIVLGTQQEAIERFKFLVEEFTDEAIRAGDPYGRTFINLNLYDRSQYFFFIKGEKKRYSWPSFHEWLKEDGFTVEFTATGESVRVSW